MRIGINARFLQKTGTGIGQVTQEFLHALARLPAAEAHTIVLFVEEIPTLSFPLPSNWSFEKVDGWYKRDDLIREYLWERFWLPRKIQAQNIAVFFSLSQSVTVLPPSIKHVMLVHDLVPLHFPEYQSTLRRRWHYRAVKQSIRRASTLLTPSHATAKDIAEHLHLPLASITTLALGRAAPFTVKPSTQEIEAVLKRYHLAPGYFYHGGGLEMRKNTKRLLEAYAVLTKKRSDTPPLVISGTIHAKTNPLATDVEGICRDLGLTERVRLLGFVPSADVPSLYSGALAFLYPSLFEGFGLPVLEALSLGVPTLTSATSSLPEVAGEAALLVDPTDTHALVHGMEELLDDAALRNQLTEKGKQQAEKFSWELFTESAFSVLLK